MTSRSLSERVRAGEVPAVARMISRVERGAPGVDAELAELHASPRHAWVIGLTGAPGSGKSTLVARLVRELCRRGSRVGVIAIDPSSPYSGGSILGDRIRMGELAGQPEVFIRSMATHGALGGLARAAVDAVTVLRAAGKDVVLIETVGVGQDEVDIVRASHTTLVVSVPGLGDDVQAIKAGVLEIADVHVVNKADRPGADRTAAELREMLRLRDRRDGWNPAVHRVVATTGEGVAELADVVAAHQEWLRSSGELERRERDMARARVQAIVHGIVEDRLRASLNGRFDLLVEEVRTRRRDPFSAALLLTTPDTTGRGN
jgi:LAO/AO transport system kinase